MKIGITVNLTRVNAYDVTVDVLNQLQSMGIRINMEKALAELFKAYEIASFEDETWVEQSDVVIAVGGDGTIIHASHLAAKYDIPILGINAGNLGFLAGLEKTELHLLENLTEGRYKVDDRMMLCCELYENNELVDKYYSLNDIVVARGSGLHMGSFEMLADGEKSMSYVSDGLIFASPTGSTAYSLSAGGPILDPTIDGIIVSPICPHSIFNRSIVFSPDTLIEVSVTNAPQCSPVISPDGETGILLNENNHMLIRRCGRRAKIIRLKPDNFTSILKKKLSERRI